jgi:hypothetical protein
MRHAHCLVNSEQSQIHPVDIVLVSYHLRKIPAMRFDELQLVQLMRKKSAQFDRMTMQNYSQ